MRYMGKKIRKTLYIPDWIANTLDEEGEKHDGPGVVVSAAIYAFCRLSPDRRISAIQEYRNEEVVKDYADAEGDGFKHKKKTKG